MKNEERKMKKEGGVSRVVCRVSSVAIDCNRMLSDGKDTLVASATYFTLTVHADADFGGTARPLPSPSTTTPFTFTVNFFSLPPWIA